MIHWLWLLPAFWVGWLVGWCTRVACERINEMAKVPENKKGKTVVFVFPIDKWVHLMVEAGAEQDGHRGYPGRGRLLRKPSPGWWVDPPVRPY